METVNRLGNVPATEIEYRGSLIRVVVHFDGFGGTPICHVYIGQRGAELRRVCSARRVDSEADGHRLGFGIGRAEIDRSLADSQGTPNAATARPGE
jgi:hypothetical protein